jgi:ElaB/YqjD/DUF883 family membrane-anchored ribosome-binding protein
MTEASTRSLIDELRAVIADAEALVGGATRARGDTHAGTDPGAGADQAIEPPLEEALRRARDGLEALEARLGAGVEKLADETAAYVRANPWPAVGIAAGVGVLIGLLLNRR